MRAADSNVLLRLVTMDDAKQFAAAAEFVRPGAWISHVVLAEVAWTLARGYDRTPAQVADSVELLLENPSLAFDDADVVRAALAAFRATTAVEFPDHLILEIARKAGHVPLGTFDRRLGKVDGAQAP